MSFLIPLLLLILFITCIIIFIIPSNNELLIKKIGLGGSFLTFIFSLCLWIFFDNSSSNFQFTNTILLFPYFNINLSFGVDGISLFFIILTTFLIPLCLLASWSSITKNVKEYFIAFLVMELFLIIVFTVLDLLLFYIFFESILIPMFLIIGIWGSRERKIRASYFLFFYTLVGSVLMLLAILWILSTIGTTDYEVLVNYNFDITIQKYLWLAFFLSFAVKVPMVPVHIWLPEAHVEAPTAGSVILAGVLLKLGTYGLLRFSFPLFPHATVYFTPLVFTLAAIAVVYTSLTAIRQSDMKRIIAYASVAHMNVVLVGMFSLNLQGLEGAILQMLSHGIVASALFLCVGVLYDRHHTRMVKNYGGIAYKMPLYAIIFLIFTLANIALPGTSSFVGELLILIGAFKYNTIAAFLAALGMILGGAYSLWLYNRVAYGVLKTNSFGYFSELNVREFAIFAPLVFLTLLMGIASNIFLEPLHVSVTHLINNMDLQLYS